MKKKTKYFQKLALITILFFLLITLTALPQTVSTGKNTDIIENVNYTVSNEKVFVSYDLLGESDQIYKVSLMLRSVGSKDVIYVPKTVSGDIGEGHFAGKGKQIIWDIKKDFPEGLSGEDYYFIVQAEEINSSSNILMWAGIGVAAVAAIVTYVVVGGDDNGSSKTNPESSFPQPPGRP